MFSLTMIYRVALLCTGTLKPQQQKMMGISDLYFYGVHVHINIGSKLVFLMNHRF